MNKVKPVPEGFHTVTPYLVVSGASQAIDFYTKAFGAREIFRMPAPNGEVMHAELQIGDSRLFLADENPEMGGRSPQTLKGTPVAVFLYVEDVDAVFQRAVAAGATAKVPVSDMFWGDRWGAVVDRFGHEWQIATHKEDLTLEEIGKRAAAAFSQSQ